MRAFAYLRKSTDEKWKQKLSLETQRDEILKAQKIAESTFWESIEIVEWFEEKVSGTDNSRPAFLKMCERFNKKEADILLSWRLDRLSRNHDDSLRIMKAVHEWAIPMIQDSNRLWRKRDTGLHMYVAFWMAVEESMQTRERSVTGTNTLVKKWWIPFMVPFWARNNRDKSADIKDRVIIDPTESRYVKMMFELKASWKTPSEISDWLFLHGFKTKNGQKIAKTTIETWIKNPFYYGVINWAWEQYRHCYTPLITKDLWDRANAPKRHIVKKSKEEFPLKMYLRTKDGRRMTASIVKKKYIMYHTYKSKDKGIYMNEDELFRLFEGNLSNYIIPIEIQPYFTDVLKDEFKSRIELIKTERENAQKELRDIRGDMDRIVDMRMDWEISSEVFARKKEQLISREVWLEEKIKRLASENEKILNDIDHKFELARNLIEYWKSGDRIKKSSIILSIAFELFITSDKRLIIQKNSLFEGVRELNLIDWSHSRSVVRTAKWPILTEEHNIDMRKFARNFLDNVKIFDQFLGVLTW